jgi:calcineurin-like phosphoesterase family protein
MKTWFTSDFHFGHQNIIKFCDRPFASVEEMDYTLVKNYEALVKPSDTVFILGDLSMSFQIAKKFIEGLPGKKFLIAGNHDFCHPANKKGRNGLAKWTEAYKSIGFEEVLLELILTVEQEKIRLHHMPYTGDHHDTEVRYAEHRPRSDGLKLLHGHVHTTWTKRGSMLNVGVDKHGFAPISLEKVKELFEIEGDLP